MSIWSRQNAPDADVKRNAVDLSRQNNLTMTFGKIYPFMVQEVLPGDTYKIDAAIGMRFLPTLFPLQTKMRADVHFFYVRSRNLYEDFINMIGNNELKSTMPYLSKRSLYNHLKTGSLGDYLGLPSTFVGSKGSWPLEQNNLGFEPRPLWIKGFGDDHPIISYDPVYIYESVGDDRPSGGSNGTHTPTEGSYVERADPSYIIIKSSNACLSFIPICDRSAQLPTSIKAGEGISIGLRYAPSQTMLDGKLTFDLNDLIEKFDLYLATSGGVTGWNKDTPLEVMPFGKGTFTPVDDTVINNGGAVYLNFTAKEDVKFRNWAMHNYFILILPKPGNYGSDVSSDSYFPTEFLSDLATISISFLLQDGLVQDYHEAVSEGEFEKIDMKINALPFRAYESIYNAFYRDERNNPYTINGKIQPNVYLPSVKGGEDDNNYALRSRNWEQDFLTSALPSPQMGAAPLVGITSSGVASFQSEDGTMYQVKLTTAEDGDTVTGATYSTNLPNDVARSIVNIASSGISINDFRAVNSLQRWLEANYRKGLKYRDQLAAHFGVTPQYDVLDMPEFLGGFSEFVRIDQVNQTSEGTADSPLGSFAGQASLVTGSKNTINKYCDEHGYIIGLVSVVPVPCYSQLLPKHFTKFDTLDYYFPEFGHIGMQPIPYREVCPLQLHGKGLDSTFGYQRAWYDYLGAVDEVHGEFRTGYRDFVLSRVFNTVPSLNPNFLTIQEGDLNNVFAVEEGDKILGQIHVDCVAKRPIPRFGIPRLE